MKWNSRDYTSVIDWELTEEHVIVDSPQCHGKHSMSLTCARDRARTCQTLRTFVRISNTEGQTMHDNTGWGLT